MNDNEKMARMGECNKKAEELAKKLSAILIDYMDENTPVFVGMAVASLLATIARGIEGSDKVRKSYIKHTLDMSIDLYNMASEEVKVKKKEH